MILLCFLAVFLAFLTVYFYFRQLEIVECVAIGTSGFLFSFAAVSVFLFSIKQFSLKRSIVGVIVLWAFLAFVSWLANRKKEKSLGVIFSKGSVYSYLLILLLLTLFHGQFGFFGMGQDEGVYQTEAINLQNGKTLWQDIIPEYDELQDEGYQQYFYETIQAILGFDMPDKSIDVETDALDYHKLYGFHDSQGLIGSWHGSPGYAALLALSSSLFGIEHMMLIQTIVYTLLLIMIEVILRMQGMNRVIRALLIAIIGISPEILWLRKSTLTELMLSLVVVLYLYFLLQEDDKKKSLSVIPVIAFGFLHFSLFTMLPLFCMNYWVLFLVKKETRFLRNVVELLLGFSVSAVMTFHLQPVYVLKNTIPIFWSFSPEMPYETSSFYQTVEMLFAIILVVGFAGTFLCYLLRKVSSLMVIKALKIGMLIIAVISVAVCLSGKAWWGWINPQLMGMSTFFGYSMLTGFLLMPVAVIALILSFWKKYSVETLLMVTTFVWTILIYAAFIRKSVNDYYYSGRYLVPYLSVIVLTYAIFIKKENEKQRWFHYLIPIIGLCCMLPFSLVVRNQQDDTHLQWRTLTGLMSHVNEGDTVLIEPGEMMRIFYYPLRSIGAKCYPIQDDIEHTILCAGIDEDSSNLLVLSGSHSLEDDWRYVTAYTDVSHYQLDDQSAILPGLRLPIAFPQQGDNTIVLYQQIATE